MASDLGLHFLPLPLRGLQTEMLLTLKALKKDVADNILKLNLILFFRENKTFYFM